MGNMTQMALEMRRALQMFLTTLNADNEVEKMMEVPSLFPKYRIGKEYKTKEVFSYGTNTVGDPQLYVVLQDHTSSEEWSPDTSTSLYKAIGVIESGYPEWVQPLGATDGYNTGDIVSHNGVLYKSMIDGNVWSPDAYPAGWEMCSDTPDDTDSTGETDKSNEANGSEPEQTQGQDKS